MAHRLPKRVGRVRISHLLQLRKKYAGLIPSEMWQLWSGSSGSAGSSAIPIASASTRSEFISPDLDMRAYQQGITLNLSRPGRPTDNSSIESFNG
jgi:transposase InsO family protein